MSISGESLPTGDPLVAGGGRSLDFRHRVILGLEYFHAQTAEGGDLFLTVHGRPFVEHLLPEKWLSPVWFKAHRDRLRGTSTIYHAQTQPVGGRSLELVVRYNRVGEDIPVDTVTRQLRPNVEFKCPFEEFATLEDLRSARVGGGRRIYTKRPLAVYSPPKCLEVWQTGRSEERFALKQAQVPEGCLDIHRQYIVVYGWIRGLDMRQAVEGRNSRTAHHLLVETMAEVERDLAEAGYGVLDMKPEHIIVRLDGNGEVVRRRDGRLMYALIDYELLERVAQGAKREAHSGKG
ncbi:MAG: hypothetical protein ACO34E_06635 [Limisphaerales bacterium]